MTFAVALLGVVSLPAEGITQVPQTDQSHHNSYLFVGADVGYLVRGPEWIDERRVVKESDWGTGDGYPPPSFGLHGGYSQGLWYLPVGVLLEGRLHFLNSGWMELRGERRYRYELALGPDFRIRNKGKEVFHFSVPFGYSWTEIHAGPGRAVWEDYGTGRGVNMGIKGVAVIATPRFGGYMGLAFLSHLTWIPRTTGLSSQPGTSVNQTYEFWDHVLLLTGGFLFRP